MAEEEKPGGPDAAAKPKAAGKGKGKGNGKKKGLGKGFVWGIVLLFVLPATGLLGWYAYQVLGHVAQDSQAALDRKAKELAAKANKFAKRAAQRKRR